MTNELDLKKIINISTLAGFALIIFLCVYGYYIGIFNSQETFQNFIISCGVFGTIIFMASQAIQVVIPILPGSIGCVVGVMAFGPLQGFMFNYIGICLGSVIAFMLAKRYGTGFVKKITKPQQYEKYSAWLDKGHRFETLFAIAIFLPVAPDDLLCFLAGLTKMSLKKFTIIILLGKPLALLMYSAALTLGAEQIIKLL